MEYNDDIIYPMINWSTWKPLSRCAKTKHDGGELTDVSNVTYMILSMGGQARGIWLTQILPVALPPQRGLCINDDDYAVISPAFCIFFPPIGEKLI